MKTTANKNRTIHITILMMTLTLVACGKTNSLQKLSLNYSAMPQDIPQTKYISIESIYSNPSDITHGKNLNEISKKLDSIASLTPQYHQELLDIERTADQLDLDHLLLIADATYFPNATYIQMVNIISNPLVCDKLTLELCQQKISQVKSNIDHALIYGKFVNQILIDGVQRNALLTTEQALIIINRSYPSLETTSPLFEKVLARFTNLSSEEKLSFLKVAILKSAWKSASDLAINWFNNDSDKQFDTLLSLAKKFPLSEERDNFLISALNNFAENISPIQAKNVFEISFAPQRLAATTLNKIKELTAHDLANIISVCKNATDKDSIISSMLGKFSAISTPEAAELIRQLNANKILNAEKIISLIINLKPKDLAYLAQNAVTEDDRDELIISSLNRFTTLTSSEASVIAEQAKQKATQIVLALFTKIPAMTGHDLSVIVEAINSGTGRDEALLAGVKLVQTSDVTSNIAILKLAYNSKLSVTTTLLSKTIPLSAMDLAFIAKDCQSTTTRDQLLIQGSTFVSIATPDGVVAMINLASQEKINVAVAGSAKISNLSSLDFGLILKSINDGPTRDQIIAKGINLIKTFSGDGAALIVERSFDFKVETATKLISLIPSASGTDLDKILAVCGSGNTRDLILTNAISLLGKLTKAEAKSLYSRSYGNKDTTAILLISKIDNLDGLTIGEIALFSAKGATRDLIITEGLKRLNMVDTLGLIAMIKASYLTTEKLAMEVSIKINKFNADNAVDISVALTDLKLKDRFLIHSIDLIKNLDEASITQLALATKSQVTKEEIVRLGVEKMENTI
jgi:hypothetical protein